MMGKTLFATIVVAVVAMTAAAATAAAPPSAAILELAGAPADTNVACGVPPSAQQGWTQWDRAPVEITLGQLPCAALLYAGATPAERVRIQELNPAYSVDAIAGAGLLVVLHEATHAAGEHDETDTECHALALLPKLLHGFGLDDAAALRSASIWDAGLPPAYHAHICG